MGRGDPDRHRRICKVDYCRDTTKSAWHPIWGAAFPLSVHQIGRSRADLLAWRLAMCCAAACTPGTVYGILPEIALEFMREPCLSR